MRRFATATSMCADVRSPLLLRERRYLYLLSDCSLLPLRGTGRRGHGRCEAGSSPEDQNAEVGLFPNLRKCSSTNSFVTFLFCRMSGGGEILGLWILHFSRVIFLTLRVCGLRTGDRCLQPWAWPRGARDKSDTVFIACETATAEPVRP